MHVAFGTETTFRMRWDFNMALFPYGDWWRRHRRAFHHHFHSNVVNKYQAVQTTASRAFLHRLLKSPSDFVYHIRQYVLK